MKTLLTTLGLLAAFTMGCTGKTDNRVEITTPCGTMIVRLYDDTPLHRDNFIHLVRSGAYDSLLFHRVISGFMIQGGDPDSRHAQPGQPLGRGQVGQTIEAEICYPRHYHKRGALAAARQADRVNPQRRSSGSQFFIVQGEVYTPDMLDAVERERNRELKSRVFYEIQPFYEDSLRYYQEAGQVERLATLQYRIMAKVDELVRLRGGFSIADSLRSVYYTIGGAPVLDSAYTVFGEVVEGLDVIDSIAAQSVDNADRPLRDVWMTMRVIE